MRRDDHDPITAEDVLSYLDGEAAPHIADRIRITPGLQSLANDYARIQGRLQQRLYRFDCPSPHMLGKYELDMLLAEDRLRIASHVVICPHCAVELRLLQDFLNVSPMEASVTPIERVRRLIATLLPPSPSTSASGALRNDSESTAQSYSAEDIVIVLDREASIRQDRWQLSGMIWRDIVDSEMSGGGMVTLMAKDGSTHTTEVDEANTFIFIDIVRGSYQMEVMLGDELITIEGLYLGP